MYPSAEKFLEAAAPFTSAFDAWAETFSPQASADHICYKCGDSAEFESLRALFEKGSAFVYQSIIAGRRIAVIKFLKPLPTALGEICFLELSDQKTDGSQASGFDHIEIYPTSGDVAQLAAGLSASGLALEKVVRPHHTTYDGIISGTFKIRLEAEPLIEKIKMTEMR